MSYTVCRDIGDADPQRMAPPKVAEYVTNIFKGTSVKVHVTDDQAVKFFFCFHCEIFLCATSAI